jgi:DNA-directed RNA polymerase specialized sigma24 family protein
MTRRRPGGAPRGIPARLEPIVVATWHANDEGPFDEPLTAAEETQRRRALFDARFPPGTMTGDLSRFLEAEYFGVDRWEGAVALVPHLLRGRPARFGHPAAQYRLREHLRARGEAAVLEWLFPTAIMVAWARGRVPRRIRIGSGIGSGWLKDECGRVRPYRPDDDLRRAGWYWRWLRRETYRYAEGMLLDDGAASADAPDTAALHARLDDQSAGAGLTPREAQALHLRVDGKKHAEVGAALGITTDAARQLRHRAERKLRRVLGVARRA